VSRRITDALTHSRLVSDSGVSQQDQANGKKRKNQLTRGREPEKRHSAAMSGVKKQKKEVKEVLVGSYTPKNIMVTGGAGFIASHVVIQLVKQFPEYKVVCFDKLDYCSSLKNLNEVKDCPNFKFIKGNLLSADLIKYVLETECIDTIIHAAAQTHVDNSFGNSFAFTENNVMGSHVLVEAAKVHGIKRFIHVSTDEVYGTVGDDIRRVETDVLEPTNPYAATKAAAENIVKSYYHSFKLPVIITRGNNVFGPHQFPEKVIPKFVRRLLGGMPCCIHGDGSNSRHYIYVGDVAAAFMTILHKGVDGETYNIGCETEFTNLEVAQRLVKALKPDCSDPKEHISFVGDRAFNDVRYYISSDKLHQLGWAPKMSFEEGLQKTIDWYAKVSPDWWEIGTDSALAPHPELKSKVSDALQTKL
jgi:UDP-glucose 4,6-dehydratase